MIYDYPPSPQELLDALEAGVAVWGAASLGALRAVELRPFGMKGVGWVYERYLNGDIESDDEVVVTLDGAGRQTSVALVCVRFGLDRLIERNAISKPVATAVVSALRDMHFSVRTRTAVIDVAAAHVSSAAARALASPRYDIKALDAAEALKAFRLSALRPQPAPSAVSERRGSPVVTRVADTTGLDRVGIATASCICPGSGDGLTVYSGKGETLDAAKTSARYECVERIAAVWDIERVCETATQDLEAGGVLVLAPESFTEYHGEFTADTVLPWVRTETLADRRECWVPADRVFIGRRPSVVPGAAGSFTTTNGLAASNDIGSAISHAILELAERHVISCVEIQAADHAWTVLGGMADRLGLDTGVLADRFREDEDAAATVDPVTLPERAARLYAKFALAGVPVVVKAVPNELGIPVYAAGALEQVSFDSFLAAAGYAARFDPESAVVAALLELAQSRATDLQGAREDVDEVEKRRLLAPPRHNWLLTRIHELGSFSADR